MFRKIVTVVLICLVAGAAAKLMDISKLDLANVDCQNHSDMIDECSLQQSFSFRCPEAPWPTNHTSLLTSCKRQMYALKCLRAYAKCSPPLEKQVILALSNSRTRFIKKLCTEKPSELALRIMEHNRCITSSKTAFEKGTQAELNSILSAEALASAKLSTVKERLRYACCSTSRLYKDHLDSTVPTCKQYFHVMQEVVDSYMADTVGIICPGFEAVEKRYECDKLPKLTTTKTPGSKYFIRPIAHVIRTLSAS